MEQTTKLKEIGQSSSYLKEKENIPDIPYT